jgi:hypothetical protein
MKKWGNGPRKKQDVDTCVMCGRIVPEGTHVCTICDMTANRKCNIKTVIECSCGKKFINKSEYGFLWAIAKHHIKQLFFDIIANMHFLKRNHVRAWKYESFD